MSQPAPDSGFDEIAVRLLRHLEWQEGFSLVFLFVDEVQAERLRFWLNKRLDFAGRPLHRLIPDELPGDPAGFTERLLALSAELPARVPVWVETFRHSADAHWNGSRRVFLARLNERRFLLERDFAHTLVVLLPRSFRQEARHIAPDIWHVRAFSDELVAPPVADLAPMSDGRVLAPAMRATPSGKALEAEREWDRIRNSSPERINLVVGWSAVDALCTEDGALFDARRVAGEVLVAARARRALVPDDAGRQRDLTVSLNNVGQVAWARGALDEAEAAYRESLGLSRELAARVGETPESLRDVSVSLDNVGQVAWARGALDEAEAAYRESLDLRRELAARSPDLPSAQDDLAVSLILVGQGNASRGELGLLREAEAILSQLRAGYGDNPDYCSHWEWCTRILAEAAGKPDPNQGKDLGGAAH